MITSRVNDHLQEEWDAWLERAPHANVFQSWAWKQAQEANGRRVATISVHSKSSGKPLAQCLVIEAPLQFDRTSVFSPRGPVYADEVCENDELMAKIAREIRQQLRARFRKSVYWRAEPYVVAIAQENGQAAKNRGVSVATAAMKMVGGKQSHDVQPAWTQILDFQANGESITADALLAAMKQKTRYNIRLAEKKGVKTQWIDVTNMSTEEREQCADRFIGLQEATAARHHIRTHGRAYYKALFAAPWPVQTFFISEASIAGASIPGAQIEGDVLLSMNISLAFGDTLLYLYGASTDAYKAYMAPYLLQWRGVQEAQVRGKRYYDLYGIAPQGSDQSHKLYGVTRFKQGFGGRVYYTPGTWEFPLSNTWYTIYQLVKRLRS